MKPYLDTSMKRTCRDAIEGIDAEPCALLTEFTLQSDESGQDEGQEQLPELRPALTG